MNRTTKSIAAVAAGAVATLGMAAPANAGTISTVSDCHHRTVNVHPVAVSIPAHEIVMQKTVQTVCTVPGLGPLVMFSHVKTFVIHW